MKPKLIVGLTGGIASGKTAVSDCFEDLGVPVIDADVVAREVVEPGEPAVEKIIELFGNQVLDSDGRLERKRLRAAIFNDPEQRKQLESLLHPIIRNRMQEKLEKIDHDYVVLSIPLLLEADQTGMVDRVLVVDVPEEEQIRRTIQRDGGSREDVLRIMSAQISREERFSRADDVIDNAGSLTELEQQVGKLDRFYRTIADSVAAGGR